LIQQFKFDFAQWIFSPAIVMDFTHAPLVTDHRSLPAAAHERGGACKLLEVRTLVQRDPVGVSPH